MTARKSLVGEVDIFPPASGNSNFITPEHMTKMMNCTIAGNIGHFDIESLIASLAGIEGSANVFLCTVDGQHRVWPLCWITADGVHGARAFRQPGAPSGSPGPPHWQQPWAPAAAVSMHGGASGCRA